MPVSLYRFFAGIACGIYLVIAPIAAETLVFPPYFHSYGIRKATPAKLFMFFGNKTVFDDPQGIAAVKMKSRDDLATVKDDDELTVYGVNSGRCEIIYNTSMWGLSIYGSRGCGKGQFSAPQGIAADPDGNVYIADCGNGRIVHLFNPKKEVQWVGAFPDKTRGDGGLVSPCQIAVDSKGLIYVSDFKLGRIAVFNASGKLCTIISGAPGALFENGPSMLAVADGADQWGNFSGEQCLYCADRNGKRLWKIDLNGAVLAIADMPSGHEACYGATDYFHSLWVTDRWAHCILKFDHNLRLLDVFGSQGTGKNQFVEPRGITIWKRFGQTFIAEKKGAQYFWVGTDLKSKKLSAAASGGWRLAVNATEFSFVSLFSLSNRDTMWVLPRRMIEPGETCLDFDGAGRRELPAPLWLKIEPTYSSYMYFSWNYPIAVTH